MTVLIRHAQSEWNLYFGALRVDRGLPDPGLTDVGRRQIEALIPIIAEEGIERIVTSPYRRTLETASALARALRLPITIDPLVRERCAFSCDQGSPPARLEADWPDIDFDGLAPVWWGGVIESFEGLLGRCDAYARKLAADPDRHRTAIVTHWGFIRGLTGLEVGNAAHLRWTPSDPTSAREQA